jgi:crotonobetainyl-CoA:carnitine CoA-transferase CaiB-like acyl-CoA transferase
VPATRVRELHEALKDPQLEHRALLHRHEKAPGVDQPFTVPLTAFKFRRDGARVDSPPPRLGEHTDEILKSVGYSAAEIAELRNTGAAA